VLIGHEIPYHLAPDDLHALGHADPLLQIFFAGVPGRWTIMQVRLGHGAYSIKGCVLARRAQI
jgi:hypothetical protein